MHVWGRYDRFNQSRADVFVQMDTYACFFQGFANGVMLARNVVNTSKIAYGLCPGCCGDSYDPMELQWMFDTFSLSGVNRLALWNLDDNLPGRGSGWPPQLLAHLADFLAANERDSPRAVASDV